MKRLFCITIYLFPFIGCSDSNDKETENSINVEFRDEINNRYWEGMNELRKGDSVMAYWNWSIVEGQWDSTFIDTIHKYKLRRIIFTQ